MAFRAHPIAAAPEIAAVGSYRTDEHALVRILESDEQGAICEDVLSDALIELSAQDLREHWRTVIPAA